MNTTPFPPQIVDFLVKVTLLLALAWSVHGMLRWWHPQGRAALWRAVFCGILLLPVLIVGLPPLRVSAPLRMAAARSEASATRSMGNPRPSGLAALAVPLATEEGMMKAAPGAVPTPISRPQAPGPMSLFSIMIRIWCAGCGILVLRFAISSWLFGGIPRNSTPAPARLERMRDQICAALGVRRAVEVRLSGDLSSPMLVGMLQPVIVLPATLLETWDERDLTAILTHEIAHVVGGDLAWNWILRWLEIALWFHPLVWPVRRAHCAACEEVCDVVAAAYVGNAPQYGQTLARVALTANARRMAFNSLPMARARSIILRLNRLPVNLRRRRIRRSFLIVGGVAALLLAGVTAAIRLQAMADEPAPVPRASKPFVVSCVDEKGQPVPDAEVYLTEWNGFSEMYHSDDSRSAISSGPLHANASGMVEFPNPIVFNGSDYARLVFARVPGKSVGGQGFMHSASEGNSEEPPQPAVVPMVASGPLRGSVKPPAGVDPRSIVVTWLSFYERESRMEFGALRDFGKPEPWPHVVERTPDKDGRFQFDDVPLQGLVFLAANGPGLGEAQYRTAETERDSFTLEMEPECVVEGRVAYAPTGKPAAGVRVYARAIPKSAWSSRAVYVTHHYDAETDADGHFHIGHLFEGSFVVNSGPNGPWRVLPTNVTVHPDKPGAVNLALEPGALVIGHVTDQTTHAPVRGILISAVAGHSGGEGLDSSRTDADGKYQLRLPTGDSLLYVASHSATFEYPKDQARRIVTIANERVVKGDVDFELARKEKELPKGVACVAKGRVLDPQGKGIPNVLLSYHVQPLPKRTDGIGNIGGPLGATNADGSYEVKLEPYSDYEIAAGGVLHSTGRSKHFETGSGTVHAIEDLVVRPALGSAAGVVVDENGEPVKNAIIEPGSKNKYAFEVNDVRSDPDGGFRIQHLLTDEPFNLYVRRPGYAARRLFSLEPGINDYRITLPHEADPPRTVDYNKSLEDGKRLIGRAAPAWDLAEWIQKLDLVPAPKRDDGRWTVLFFVRGCDDAGVALANLLSAIRASNAAPVAIFESMYDRHLPMAILAKTPLRVAIGMDRFSADSGMADYSATRIAYGRQSIYVLDASGVVRGVTSKMEEVEKLLGK